MSTQDRDRGKRATSPFPQAFPQAKGAAEMTAGMKIERPLTAGQKRRSVVRVLRSAMHDAQREVGNARVTGIFGVVIKEDGSAYVLSAVTADELKIVLKAIPEALHRTSQYILRGGDESPTQ